MQPGAQPRRKLLWVKSGKFPLREFDSLANRTYVLDILVMSPRPHSIVIGKGRSGSREIFKFFCVCNIAVNGSLITSFAFNSVIVSPALFLEILVIARYLHQSCQCERSQFNCQICHADGNVNLSEMVR